MTTLEVAAAAAYMIIHSSSHAGASQSMTVIRYPSMYACAEGLARMKVRLTGGEGQKALVSPIICAAKKPSWWR